MPGEEKEPMKDKGGEFADTQSTIDANTERVKLTEKPKPDDKPSVKWIQD